MQYPTYGAIGNLRERLTAARATSEKPVIEVR